MSEELAAKVKKAIAALTVGEPFIGIMLKRTWILYDPNLTWTPATTDGLRIRLGPEAAQLDERKMAALLAHEVVHIALKHPTRLRHLWRKYGLPRRLLNVLADAVVNKYVLETDAGKYLEKMGPVLPKHIEEHFGIKDVEKKSLEELAKEVVERLPKVGVKIEVISARATFGDDVGRPETPAPQSGKPAGGKKEGKEGGRGEGGREEGEKAGGRTGEKGGEGEGGEEAAKREGGGGESREEGAAPAKGRGGGAGFGEGESREEGEEEVVVVNEGDPGEHPSRKFTEEEIERRIERKVTSAVETAKRMKGAGTQPGFYERILKELLKPKVDWRRVLRERLRHFFGSDYIPTWTRVNKKLPWVFPGKAYLERGDAICLVDTSGSIGEKELHQFIAEVFAIARAARRRVVVIPWDAVAYPPIEIRGNEDIRRVKVTGGGGTVILPALEAAEKLLRPTTRIVILSDWDIFDINSPKVQAWLKKYSHQILAVTTLRQPPPFLQSVKIEL
ncbi:MAG: VWA-like domain-containing protein [Thermofilum sp.]|nr:VWA-like domain-containing protein [Thermofilum sp.]